MTPSDARQAALLSRLDMLPCGCGPEGADACSRCGRVGKDSVTSAALSLRRRRPCGRTRVASVGRRPFGDSAEKLVPVDRLRQVVVHPGFAAAGAPATMRRQCARVSSNWRILRRRAPAGGRRTARDQTPRARGSRSRPDLREGERRGHPRDGNIRRCTCHYRDCQDKDPPNLWDRPGLSTVLPNIRTAEEGLQSCGDAFWWRHFCTASHFGPRNRRGLNRMGRLSYRGVIETGVNRGEDREHRVWSIRPQSTYRGIRKITDASRLRRQSSERLLTRLREIRMSGKPLRPLTLKTKRSSICVSKTAPYKANFPQRLGLSD